MLIMPANSTGWFWHCLARETGMIGHLFSPRAQRGPWPWFPYALDNGAFSCWNRFTNEFDEDKWAQTEQAWRELLFWTQCREQKPMWAIVPDYIGNAKKTIEQWGKYASEVQAVNIPLAVGVQDGMTAQDVRGLDPEPYIVCVGGTTEWKWDTVEMWAKEFPRVHVLRCNSPDKLEYLYSLKTVLSTDGTGWNRGNRKQTLGLEKFCHRYGNFTPKKHYYMTEFVSRKENPKQVTFA